MTNLPQLPPVIRAYVEALNAGDFPLLMSLFTDDALIFGVLGSGPVAKAEAVWRELHGPRQGSRGRRRR
jgi:ketosteroid isomerase-like protein